MATISLTLPVAGTVITAGLHATNYTAIQGAINGGLDNNNIAGGAAIAYSKLSLANALLMSDISTGAGNAWTAYSPTWTVTSGGAPVLGNGTLSGRYVRIGKTVHGVVALVAGSTTSFGGGPWKISLPVAALASPLALVGSVYAEDFGAQPYGGILRMLDANNFVLYKFATPSATFDATNPFAWGSGDFFYAGFTYEAA